MKIVIDTDVVISASISAKGAAHYLLDFFSKNENYSIVSCSKQQEEIKRVAMELCPKFKINTQVISNFYKTVKLIKIKEEAEDLVNDENDAFILSQAIESWAKYLITYNVSDYKQAEIYEKHDIIILTPALFLQNLRKHKLY